MRQELLSLLQPVRTTISKKQWKHIETADKWCCEKYIHPPQAIGHKSKEESLGVIELLLRLHQDAATFTTALLYPLLKQQSVELSEIRETFGKEIAAICESLLKLPTFDIPEQSEQNEQALLKQQAESFSKMLLSIAQDMRVILFKFCERLFFLKQLEWIPIKQQRIVAHECREIYAPLSNRLGISWLKNELEDLSLRYLYPHDFYGLVEQLNSKQNERKDYIEDVKQTIEDICQREDITCDVAGRSKHINSIYNKMRKKKLTFSQLFDVTAFRLICETKAECYQLLGAIHSHWKPIPGRFKDYIAVPKPNLYQSLHTTVFGPHNKRMEIQIRTHEMHRLAEEGIAAHWLYKEKNNSNATKQSPTVEKFQWLRNLLQLKDERDDAQAFMASVRDYLEEEEVFVFTPKGHVKELPKGATALDFAFSIHTDVGYTCVGAKVNNKIVPLRYELKNGDLVDILTSPSSEPKQHWLKFVYTNRAKTKIRSHLRLEQREQALAKGREWLEKELPTNNKSINKLLKQNLFAPVLDYYNQASFDELLMQIGFQKISAEDVVLRLFPPEQTKEEPEEIELVTQSQPTKRRSSRGVLVDGMDDIMAQLAGCCNPIPGDPIVGFISRGRGVIVHRKNCAKIQSRDPNRHVEVSWHTGQEASHTVHIRVVSENRPGLLSLQSKIFADLNINISAAQCETDDDEAINTFKCQVSDLHQLKRVLRQLEDIRGVLAVQRLRH